MSETETTPLETLASLVRQIETQKRVIDDANLLPETAARHVDYMVKKLNDPCIFSATGERWPDIIKKNAGDAFVVLKRDLIAQATSERDRRNHAASLAINTLAAQIDGLSKDVARSLIVNIPAANEG